MGTPAFARPSLEGLIEHKYEIALVVSQPDRPAGRGRRMTPPPVAALAHERGLPLFQPASLKPPEAFERVRMARPDVIVVAAFGLILRREVLDLPPLGCLNVHASLLPRHRGAAPIQSAILAGDQETGVCIMRMEVGLDTGPVLSRSRTPIAPHDDTPRLTDRLATMGGDLLIRTLPEWAAGRVQPEPQDDRLATYAPRVQREDAHLDWSLPAVDLWRRVRAYRGWPDAFTTWNGKVLKVLAASALSGSAGGGPPPPGGPRGGGGPPRPPPPGAGGTPALPGKVLLAPDGRHPTVTTGEGLLTLDRVALEGRRPSDGVEFLRGQRDFVGAILGT